MSEFCKTHRALPCRGRNASWKKSSPLPQNVSSIKFLVLSISPGSPDFAWRLGEVRHEEIAVRKPRFCCADRGACRKRRGYGIACEIADAGAGVELVRLLRRAQCRLCAQHDGVERFGWFF